MKKRIAAALAVFAAQSALFIRPVEAHTVTATVYSDWYEGRTTACGQAYNHWGVSAAHPYLPCGTRVRINHKGRVLTVRVNDRCNCDIDLSAGAAYRLGVPIDGIAAVSISY